MKVLVAGGTGLIGREITRSLLDAGHDVTVLTRSKPAPDPFGGRASWVLGDALDPATLPAAVAGRDVVIDAVQFPKSPIENPRKGHTFERVDLGATVNLADAAKAAGVSQFIDISGAGSAADAPYHWQRFKWQAEQHTIASGVPYTIFRPSWIYGPDDVSLNRFLGFAKFLPFIPVIGNGKTRINPLFIGDLGKHVVAAVGNPAALSQLFEIGGPKLMTMDEIIRTSLQAAGKKRFLLHQPK
ncbi:MAG TPA: NAD(P)H-binding protein, partial [Tepidiformaceae bacterium]|nr:NAD(P)H-binding protein [Tepidiformaceae bacterium]